MDKDIHISPRPYLNIVVQNMLGKLQKIWNCSTSEAAKRVLNPLAPQILNAIEHGDPSVYIKVELHLDPDYWEYRTPNMAADWENVNKTG